VTRGRSPARVLVLGGGFGGLYAASYLATADLPEDALEVTLVSDSNYFTFTPLLAEVVAGNLGQQDVTVPYRVLARQRGFRFIHGRVEGVDPGSGTAYTTAGTQRFDYAVIALGARPHYFGSEEVRRESLPFASVGDAMRIRNRALAMAERAEQESSATRRRHLLTFAVAGAGPAGVEVASELRHLISEVLPRYYRLRTEPRVVLIHGGDRILHGWDETLAARGEEELRSQGIELHLSTRVTRFDGRVVTLSAPHGPDGVEADTLIWAAGTRPETEGWDASGIPRTPTGHVPVEPTLALPGSDHVFSVGDIASLRDAHSGEAYPPVAPIAISQGVRAAANIVNAIEGRPLEPYGAYHAGKIISLGNGVAFADVLGIQLRGRPAWMLYRTAYLLKLVGAKNKLRAAMTLLLNRVFERDLSAVDA